MGSTKPFKSNLRPLRKHCRACSKISKNTSLMADLFADQIINGESTGASDLAGRTRSPSFVELVLILCLVAKEQFSALCLSMRRCKDLRCTFYATSPWGWAKVAHNREWLSS